MRIVPQKDSAGQDVPGQYLVIVSSLFGDAILYGPASLADCESFVISKIKELAANLGDQIVAEKTRLIAEQKKTRSSGMEPNF
jgi:hypothetical protein